MSFLLVGHGNLFTFPSFSPLNLRGNEKGLYLFDGCVAIKDQTIVEVGPTSKLISKYPNSKFIDAKGGLILPGFICAHHHFYSALARGMAIPGTPPKNFLEILKKLWWKLDNALDAESIYYSSLVSAIDCLKHGVTTVVDHHESQSYQLGSLDQIEKAVNEVGLRANLCLGVSDRYGRGKEGIEENKRFISKLPASSAGGATLNSQLVSASVGLHASFTVEDSTLEQCVELSKKYNVGIHTHCAEDILDEKGTEKKYHKSVVERFYQHGALGEKSLLIHCVHINDKELDLIRKTKTNVVHNPESNMNNAVGAADILKMIKKGITVGIGTDGMSSEMVSQTRTAYLLQKHFHKDPRVAFVESGKMLLQNNPKIFSKLISSDGRESETKVGVLKPGALADVIVMDYIPPTPLSEKNFFGHLLFGLPYAQVNTVIVNGKLRLKDKKLVDLDEQEIFSKSRESAQKLWKRIV